MFRVCFESLFTRMISSLKYKSPTGGGPGNSPDLSPDEKTWVIMEEKVHSASLAKIKDMLMKKVNKA